MRLLNSAIIATVATFAMIGHAWANEAIAVPEPASLSLLAVAGMGMALAKFRRRK